VTFTSIVFLYPFGFLFAYQPVGQWRRQLDRLAFLDVDAVVFAGDPD
jgi:hypothetical protein